MKNKLKEKVIDIDPFDEIKKAIDFIRSDDFIKAYIIFYKK